MPPPLGIYRDNYKRQSYHIIKLTSQCILKALNPPTEIYVRNFTLFIWVVTSTMDSGYTLRLNELDSHGLCLPSSGRYASSDTHDDISSASGSYFSPCETVLKCLSRGSLPTPVCINLQHLKSASSLALMSIKHKREPGRISVRVILCDRTVLLPYCTHQSQQ